MIHEGQGLTLGFEPGDDVSGIHPQLDNLQGNAATNGLLLLSHIYDAATPFPKSLEQFVASDGFGLGSLSAEPHFARGKDLIGVGWSHLQGGGTLLKEIPGPL